MKTPISIIFFSFLLCSPLYAADYDSVLTHGEGEVKIKPDVLRIDVAVVTRAKGAKEAQTKNAKETENLHKALSASHIEAKDIQTQNYSVDPEYQYEKNKRIFQGYVVQQTLLISVHKLEGVSELLDKLVENQNGEEAAITINNTRYDTEKRKDYEAQALTAAMSNARARAEALAKASGKSLKDVRHISDSQVSFSPINLPMHGLRRAALMGSDKSEAPTLSPGEIVMTSSVSVEFSF